MGLIQLHNINKNSNDKNNQLPISIFYLFYFEIKNCIENKRKVLRFVILSFSKLFLNKKTDILCFRDSQSIK